MIISVYYSELVVTGDFAPRWKRFYISILFIAYELLDVFSAATKSETDLAIRNKISNAQVMTVVSWCIYKVICFVHMLGINAASSGCPSRLVTASQTLSLSVALES